MKDILLFQLVPVLLIVVAVVFRKSCEAPKIWVKAAAAMIAVCCMLVSVVNMGKLVKNDPRYTYEYNFSDAVRSFGLSNAVYLDIKYAGSGVPEAPRSIYGGKIYYSDEYVAMESFPGETSVRYVDGVIWVKTENSFRD